jgi:hypothetical protein
MAPPTITLAEVSAQIARDQSVMLNEGVAGTSLLAFLKQVFPRQKEFRLTGCQLSQEPASATEADTALRLSGHFQQLFPWENVQVEVSLFDAPPAVAAAPERQAVFCLTIPSDSDAVSYFKEAGARDLEDIISTIRFNALPMLMLFSSIDYSLLPQGDRTFYPIWYARQWSKAHVRKGLNFQVEGTFDDELTEYVWELLQQNNRGETGLAEAITIPTLIFAEEGGAYARFTAPIPVVDIQCGSLQLKLTGIRLTLPLAQDEARGVQIGFDGAVTIGSKTLTIQAELHPYYPELSLSCGNFPSLQEIVNLLQSAQVEENRGVTAPSVLPEPMTRLLKDLLSIQLSELTVVLDLAEPSVLVVSLAVCAQRPIHVIPDIVSIAPTLAMQIYEPFDANTRSIEGTIAGQWLIGEGAGAVAIDTTLSIPALDFFGGLPEKRTLSLKALLARLNAGIDLGDRDLTITTMEVAGNFSTKSFSAELGVDAGGTWSFQLGGKFYGLTGIAIWLAYVGSEDTSPGQTTFGMEGQLMLANANFVLSAEYEADQGWTLSGGPAVGTTINLTGLSQELLHSTTSLSLPDGFPEVELRNILFTAEPKSGHVSVSGQTSVKWGFNGLNLNVEHVSFERSEGQIGARILVDLTIPDVATLRLSAEKTATAEGGWDFRGNTGQRIEIKKLVQALDRNATLPSALEGLTIENLAVSFNTGTKRVAFRCQGNIPLGADGPMLACTVDIAVDGTTQKAEFGGTLTVGDAEFTLQFEKDTTKKALRATWQYQEGKPSFDLTALGDGRLDLSALGEQLTPTQAGLMLTIQERETRLSLACEIGRFEAAFLLVSRKEPPATIVAFGLKPPNLSTQELGALGKALDPHNIALKNLVILAANETLTPGANDSNLELANKPYPVSKGLFLQGALEFGQTSFSYPFECRLGSGQPEVQAGAESEHDADNGSSTPVRTGKPDTTIPAPATVTSERTEGGNNVTVGRTIGPVTFRKVRFESREDPGGKRIYLLLDASLGSGGFNLDLDGFNINFPLNLLTDATKGNLSKLDEIGVGLDGLSIAYSNPPLTVCGGFSKVSRPPEPYVELYEGHLLIEAKAFQIAVLGSYGTILIKDVKRPSLFVYGMYNGVVGGPAAFFVTGLALGGGYNTRLKLPPVEQVAEFPLVQAVTDPTKFKSEALRHIAEASYGDYWLALGIKFTSFKMAESFALFTVAFGNRLQFALLGLTKFTVPTEAERGQCAVYAELQIRAVLDPDAGVFSFEGRLTNHSYVFMKEIHLTGGFAFFVWFGNAKEAGDFVISLGGYHPDFIPPPHYPVVPRIGIHGQLASALTVSGEVYFALTPSCLMAGIKLAAVFDTDIITATFIAYADFIVAWAPFHYDGRIGIGIAVWLKSLRSVKLELGADLHIWGPPFAGRARVSYYLVSFTVEFGETSDRKVESLTWEQFEQAFLPVPERKPEGNAEHALLGTIRITEGLVREVKRENDSVTYRVVNPHELTIETDSVVPCTTVSVGSTKDLCKAETTSLGIRPMAVTQLSSCHAVSISKTEGARPVEDKFTAVRWSRKSFPEALWSPIGPSQHPDAKMIEGVLSGVVLRVTPRPPQHRLGPFPIEIFKWEPIEKDIPWATAAAQPGRITETFTTVSRQNSLRDQIRNCLSGTAWNEIKVTNTADKPLDFFQAPPACAKLGQSLA